MIDTLSEKQECLMDEIVKKYEDYCLSGDDSYDLTKINSSINFIYELSELKKPKQIIICASPMDIKVQAGMKEGETIDWNGCGYDSGWTAFYDFFEQIGVEYDKDMFFTEWKTFITETGVFATALYENIAFVCVRPCEVHRKDNGDLHNEKGMAIKWRDGYGEYALNGVIVSREIVETPAEQLDPNLILTEKNVEVRREIVRKIGIERVCQKLKAKVIDKQDDVYELLNLDLGENRVRPYLKMKNPSIPGVYHIEGVHPNCKTVQEALNWRNNTEEKPEILT